MEAERFDVEGYLRCDCASVENQTCDKCAVRGHIASLTRELEEAKDDLRRRHNDAVDRWEALRAIFDVPGVDGNCDVEAFRRGQDMRASEQMRMIAARALGLSRALPSQDET
jgi:hypothetical protein